MNGINENLPLIFTLKPKYIKMYKRDINVIQGFKTMNTPALKLSVRE